MTYLRTWCKTHDRLENRYYSLLSCPDGYGEDECEMMFVAITEITDD